SVANPWVNIGSINDAVAQGDIAFPIHGDAAHPAVHAIAGGVSTLLEHGEFAVAPPYLVPAHAGDSRTRLHRLIRDHRFVIAEVPVSKSPGWTLPVGQDIEVTASISDPGFRQAVSGARRLRSMHHAAGENRVKRRYRKLSRQFQGCGRLAAPAD